MASRNLASTIFIMKNRPHTLPLWIINLLFVVGLISGVSFRSLMVLQYFQPDWVKPVWYVGVCGYLCFFFYRYKIALKRRRAIDEHCLIEKLQSNEVLADDDRETVIYLLSSLKKSREMFNYLFIFVLSAIAISIDLYLTFLK